MREQNSMYFDSKQITLQPTCEKITEIKAKEISHPSPPASPCFRRKAPIDDVPVCFCEIEERSPPAQNTRLKRAIRLQFREKLQDVSVDDEANFSLNEIMTSVTNCPTCQARTNFVESKKKSRLSDEGIAYLSENNKEEQSVPVLESLPAFDLSSPNFSPPEIRGRSRYPLRKSRSDSNTTKDECERKNIFKTLDNQDIKQRKATTSEVFSMQISNNKKIGKNSKRTDFSSLENLKTESVVALSTRSSKRRLEFIPPAFFNDMVPDAFDLELTMVETSPTYRGLRNSSQPIGKITTDRRR
ncbi:hypothetical protein HK096_001573, partial [Nowakowskiella sp. JEL0078]